MEYLKELKAYVDAHYTLMVEEPPRRLDDLADNLEEPFSVALIKMINKKGLDETEVYKRANVDRRHFSKIRSNAEYTPSKKTALAFVIALELTLAEARGLLARAGYALSRSSLTDVIVEYFIVNKRYDIFDVNDALHKFGQPLLGAVIE